MDPKSFYTAEVTIVQVNEQPKKWKITFISHTSERMLALEYINYTQKSQMSRNQTIQLQTGTWYKRVLK